VGRDGEGIKVIWVSCQLKFCKSEINCGAE
jgi:hypothetical protein